VLSHHSYTEASDQHGAFVTATSCVLYATQSQGISLPSETLPLDARVNASLDWLTSSHSNDFQVGPQLRDRSIKQARPLSPAAALAATKPACAHRCMHLAYLMCLLSSCSCIEVPASTCMYCSQVQISDPSSLAVSGWARDDPVINAALQNVGMDNTAPQGLVYPRAHMLLLYRADWWVPSHVADLKHHTDVARAVPHACICSATSLLWHHLTSHDGVVNCAGDMIGYLS
jgi:hypothetical protein